MKGVQLTVVGMVVGKTGVTLYLDNGSEMHLASDGWRTKDIVEQIAIPLAVEGSAPLNLGEFSLAQKIEELTGGAVRLEGDDPALGKGDFALVAGDKKIENASKIHTQLERAIFGKGEKGFAAFMKFYGELERAHSAEDLLTFMEKGKMHIADDGSIVAFKSLSRKNDGFVDTHTRSVKQNVGTRVEMDEKEVDPDREQDCSYGLHIATHHYIRDFSGDGLFLVKIRPQDVIAVPRYNTTKMRVCRYDVVAQLSKSAETHVRGGQSLETHEAGQMELARVIAGDHAPITEIVRTGKNGRGERIALETPIVSDRNEVRSFNHNAPQAGTVRPKEVNKLVNAAITGDLVTALNSAVETAQKTKTSKKAKAAPVKQVAANAPYTDKFKNAVELFKAGKSIRDIAKMLKMDRESLGKKLRVMGLLK